jgi:hypothetical protein
MCFGWVSDSLNDFLPFFRRPVGDPVDQPEASAGKESVGTGRSGGKVLEDLLAPSDG